MRKLIQVKVGYGVTPAADVTRVAEGRKQDRRSVRQLEFMSLSRGAVWIGIEFND